MPKMTKKPSARTTKPQKTPETKHAELLPGFVRFSKNVFSVLRENRSVFGRLIALAVVISLLMTGLTAYTYYTGLTQATDEVAGQLPEGGFRTFIEVGALTASVVSGAASNTLTETQQVFAGIFYLLLWLVTVWLLRHLMSGNAVKLRDGLYNAASPLVSTCLVVLAGVAQILPFALVVALVSSIASTGAVNGLFWVVLGVIVVVLFAALTLYWLAGTVFAAVIVTLPGTYPWSALRSARQVITGYRRSVVLRLLWLGFISLVAMVVAVLPVVLLDALSGYRFSPFVVLASQLAGATLFVYGSAYVYLLYRGVIDERG